MTYRRRGLAQLIEKRLARFDVAEALAQTASGSGHLVQIAQHLERGRPGRGMFLGGLGAKVESRILEQALAHGLRAAQESRAKLADIAAAQLRSHARLSQAETVLAVIARDRQ